MVLDYIYFKWITFQFHWPHHHKECPRNPRLLSWCQRFHRPCVSPHSFYVGTIPSAYLSRNPCPLWSWMELHLEGRLHFSSFCIYPWRRTQCSSKPSAWCWSSQWAWSWEPSAESHGTFSSWSLQSSGWETRFSDCYPLGIGEWTLQAVGHQSSISINLIQRLKLICWIQHQLGWAFSKPLA